MPPGWQRQLTFRLHVSNVLIHWGNQIRRVDVSVLQDTQIGLTDLSVFELAG